MKKTLGVVLFLACTVFWSPGQEQGPIDLILLLDTSASMSGSYREVSDYITGPFLREFLRMGDTFHLISFSDSPQPEISRRIEGVGDLETIIGRMLLMYPLDLRSNVSGALDYAERYISSLPAARQKKIVLVTDGGDEGASLDAYISEASSRLGRSGTTLQVVKTPLTGGGPSSGRAPLASASRAATGTAGAGSGGSPGAAAGNSRGGSAAPAPAPARTEAAKAPGASGSDAPAPAPARTEAAKAPGASGSDTVPGAAVAGSSGGPAVSPNTPPEPGGRETVDTGETGDVRAGYPPPAEPPRGEPPADGTGEGSAAAGDKEPPQASGSGGRSPAPADTPPTPARIPPGRTSGEWNFPLPLPLLIALGILAALIIGLIVFLTTRRLQRSPNQAMSYAVGRSVPLQQREASQEKTAENRNVELLASYAAKQRKGTLGVSTGSTVKKAEEVPNTGPILLSLFVEDQNTAIGRRNIHSLKPGYTYTLGGGKSDYLIFLVPMPPHIAEIHCDGNSCTLVPKKPQFFPDIGSQPVPGCIGKTIRVISEKNYELFIRMERYEDPLKSLNRLMNSVEIPK